jgi:hypothetical protein
MFAQVRPVPAAVCKASAEPTQVRTLDLLPLAGMPTGLRTPRLIREPAETRHVRLYAAQGTDLRPAVPNTYPGFARSRARERARAAQDVRGSRGPALRQDPTGCFRRRPDRRRRSLRRLFGQGSPAQAMTTRPRRGRRLAGRCVPRAPARSRTAAGSARSQRGRAPGA